MPATPTLDASTMPVEAIAERLRRHLSQEGRVDLLIPDPDDGEGLWPGEPRPDGAPRRDWRAWLDLAEAVGARMRTPRPVGGPGPRRLRLPFVRLAGEAELHADGGRPENRYDPRGAFARLRKTEHPGFLLPLLDAVAFAAPEAPRRVLVVGCHRGDEIEALTRLRPPVPPALVTGLDREAGALDEARRRFPAARFVQADLRDPVALADLAADAADAADADPAAARYDLIVAIDVLQSPDLEGAAALRTLVRELAAPSGGLVIGLPCSRFRGGEVVWGARTRNFAEVDLSLVVRDLAGHRRYLHQQGYRSRIGGRYDLLLTARRDAASKRDAASGRDAASEDPP